MNPPKLQILDNSLKITILVMFKKIQNKTKNFYRNYKKKRKWKF